MRILLVLLFFPLLGYSQNTWKYIRGGDGVNWAYIKADNTISFENPPNPDCFFVLTVYNEPGFLSNDFTISLLGSRCQFDNTDDGGWINVSFDNGRWQSYRIIHTIHGTSGSIDISDPSIFFYYLRHSRTVKIKAPFYHNGNHVIYFTTKNFKYRYLL